MVHDFQSFNRKIWYSAKEFLETAKKLKEPTGFIIERFHYKTDKNNEWVGLGLILSPTTTVKFADGEVTDFKWLTPEELKEYLKKENNYCVALPMVFEKAEKFVRDNL